MRHHRFALTLAATGAVALAGCASSTLTTRTAARAPAPQLVTGSMIPQTQPQANPALRIYGDKSLQNTPYLTPAPALQYLDPSVSIVNH